MSNIDSKYESWKNKLLDLGKRNRLLNYKDTPRSNIKIEYPDCLSLYDLFVKEETQLVFPFSRSDDEENSIVSNSNVETNKSISDLQKALRNLRNKAKTAIEEQGINVLYLSFGFLNWTENENSDQIFMSPLVLVPVSLTIESINSPYILSLHEDEIIVNPTLSYKLDTDFGIALPPFDDAGDLNAFLSEVENKTNRKNWSVSKDVGLSLLSFLKINMYSDLNKHKDSIVENPIVKAIGGDVTAIDRVPEEISDYDFDRNEKPIDVFQIVDADASQQDAILMAKKGVSFVLQGPPGTGKSQTITNIIAESLADGKKVLFVSEKMAALDVVHKRLSNAGLNDFCLVLHSHKANKKNVLEQLSKVLDFSQQKASLKNEALLKLEALQAEKNKLNAYADQVYSNVEPLGRTIYEVNGILANLNDYDDFIFHIDDIRNVDREQYNRYLYLLRQLSSAIGKMSGECKDNPWRNCKLSSVSNEFRHDATAYLNKLLGTIKEFDSKFSEIQETLYLNLPHTFNDVSSTIDLLTIAQQAHKVPPEWILTDELLPLYDEIESCAEIRRQFITQIDDLKNEYDLICQNEQFMELSPLEELNSEIALAQEKNTLETFISTASQYSNWSITQIDNISDWLQEAKKNASNINSLKNDLLSVYESTVFELDYRGILARIKTEYTSLTKIFKKSYWQDKKTIMLHHRDIGKKITDKDMLALIEVLKNIDEAKQWYVDNAEVFKQLFANTVFSENTDYSIFEKQIIAYRSINNAIAKIDKMLVLHNDIAEKEETLQTHYKFLYKGILSDWNFIREALNWATNFKQQVSQTNASNNFVQSVCQADEFIIICERLKEQLNSLILKLLPDYKWFVSNFDQPEIFNGIDFKQLYMRFNACLNSFSLLEEWVDYNHARKNCIAEGLDDFIETVEKNNISASCIEYVFKKRFFRLWLDAILPEFPAVMYFRRKKQESTIKEFANLDTSQFRIARDRIKIKLINALPSPDHFTEGLDEISILKRELNKQRKIKPIRLLFKEIPNLLLTLKPCLMMSPLSVSLFLEAETYKFDVVIFDEASQVCTENAIGAISRAKQVIIAGDSKQLPPTNFFHTTISENDFDIDAEDDIFDDSDAYESILDEASMLPERTLRWHYRSRHESLIAFSNAKIYKNKLITFPSNIEKRPNNGVEYIYVPEGYYDKGGRKGNIEEANKVADLVFQHFRENPHRSLGVIAFGEVQQQAIETVIRERRLKNQNFEKFFAEDSEEAFFIKNLENVQGDERDTIIFSIGYCRDQNGKPTHNFGPLSRVGGERRLNVAITRAKYNVKLVGSIMPTDIDTNKVSNDGPKLLRAYIEFAMNGPELLDREITETDIIEHDSPFEEAVYNFLDKKGYRLGTQVGCSGYRIDMAVKHPTYNGIYVLGIECDGAAYHSARTARERDRLRQDVLENMGWKIYRIWSTDWIKDSVAEGKKLIKAIDYAISCYGTNNDSDSVSSAETISGDKPTEFVNVEKKDKKTSQADNPYGFEKMQEATFHNYWDLADCIVELVDKEYPIHHELICQKLASRLGNKKATVKIRGEVDCALSKLNEKIIRQGDFFFPLGYQSIPVRWPNDRKIQHIHTKELSMAMLHILKNCVGANRDALSTETARVYGFNRAGQNIAHAMAEAIDSLIESGWIEELEGKLKIKGSVLNTDR